MPDLKVHVRSDRRTYVYGETLWLFVRATNLTQRPLYLVTDRLYPSPIVGNEMRILHGQIPIPENLSYFGYQRRGSREFQA
jgi:hypothetical protein